MRQELDRATLDILISKGIIKESDIDNLTSENDNRGVSSVLGIKESISAFHRFMRKEYSDNTAKGYKLDVESFISFALGVQRMADINSNEILPEFKEEQVSKWFASLASNGYEATSIKRYKHSISKYFEYLNTAGVSAPSITFIPIPPIEKSEIEAMRDDEVRAMAEYAGNLRSKVIILVMYEAGMRRQELIDCEKSHIDFSDRTVKIFNNGRFDRVGYLSDSVCDLVQQYIEEWEYEVVDINNKRKKRELEKGDKYRELKVSKYLLQTSRSEQISYSTIYKALKETAYEYFLNKSFKAGLSQEEAKEVADVKASDIDTDTLRHSRRAFYFSIGKSLEQVQAIMGDENRWICRRYLAVAQRLYPENFR